MKRLVLLGGGHSHFEVLRRFRDHPGIADITLVDPARFATYSGMLPGFIAGHYAFHDCHIDLAGLAKWANASFVQTSACGMETAQRRLMLDNGARLDYDLISIDVGSVAASAVPGVAENAIPVRPVTAFLHNWATLLEHAATGKLKRLVVVGGGPAGVELILAMQHRIAQSAASRAVRFSLVSDADCILPGSNARARALLQRVLSHRAVEVHVSFHVTAAEPGAVVSSSGTRVAADAIFWATGAAAPPWLRETGLQLDAKGFIAINEHLRSMSHSNVFAAGDCATMLAEPAPKSGVYAVRQGPILAENLLHALAGKPLVKYHPQRLALALISSGDRCAVASYGNFALAGAWVWRWKDYIDRKFVARYRVAGATAANPG